MGNKITPEERDRIVRQSTIEKITTRPEVIAPTESLPMSYYAQDFKIRSEELVPQVGVGDLFTEVGRSRYDEGTPFSATMRGFDGIQDWRGAQQSRLDKLIHAPIRLGASIPMKFMEMAGYTATALGWAATGDISTMTENPLSVSIRNAEEWMKSVFPIYKPQHVREGNLGANLWSLSFWADEAVDAVAFFASAAAMGYLTGGLSPYLSSIGVSANVARNVGLATAVGAQTLGEAGTEAAHAQKEMRIRRDQELEKYSQQLHIQELTPEQIEQMVQSKKLELDQSIDEAAANIFRTNAVVLIGPNLIMSRMLFGKLFDGKANVINRAFDATGALQKATPIAGREAAKKIGGSIFAGIGSEGFWEEGMQETASKYWEAVAFGETDKGIVDGFISTYFESLGDVDFQKAIVLGGLLGGLGGVRGATSQIAAQNAQISRLNEVVMRNPNTILETLVNRENFNPQDPKTYNEQTAQVIDQISRIATIAKNSTLQDIMALSDKAEIAEFIENNTLLNWALPLLTLEGGIRVLEKQIDSMTESAFKEYSEKNTLLDKADFATHKANLVSKIKQFQETYDHVNNKYGGMLYYLPNTYNLDSKKLGQAKNAFIQNILLAQINTDSNLRYINSRIKQFEQQLTSLELSEELGADAGVKTALKNNIEGLIKVKETLQEDFKELTNKENLFAYFDAHVQATIELEKAIEDAMNKSEQEVSEEAELSEEFKQVINDATSTEVIEHPDGTTTNVKHSGEAVFTIEDTTKPEGSDERFREVKAKVLGTTEKGNLRIQLADGQVIGLASGGQIFYKKGNNWTHNANNFWRDISVVKSAEQTRKEYHQEVFGQSLIEVYGDIVSRIENNNTTLESINASIAAISKSISRALSNKSQKAKIPVNEITAEALNREVEIGKNIMLHLRDLEVLQKELNSLRDNLEKTLLEDITLLEQQAEQFDPKEFEDINKMIADEKAVVEKTLSSVDRTIAILEDKIKKLKSYLKGLATWLNNQLNKLYTPSEDVNNVSELSKEEYAEFLDKISQENQFKQEYVEKVNKGDLKIIAAQRELEVAAKERDILAEELANINQGIKERNELLSKYHNIIRATRKTASVPQVVSDNTLSDGKEEGDLKEAEKEVISPMHPFRLGVSDELAFTTAKQLTDSDPNNTDFEKNPEVFEPQLAFQEFIDTYDTNSDTKRLKLVTRDQLVALVNEHIPDSATRKEILANLNNDAAANGIFAVLHDAEGDVHTQESLFREGENIILWSVLSEATKDSSGNWANKRTSGQPIVAYDSWAKNNPGKTEQDFNQTFHTEYQRFRTRAEQATTDGTLLRIDGATSGVNRMKNSNPVDVVGSLVNKSEDLGDVEIIMGKGATINVGGVERMLVPGYVLLQHRNNTHHTYRQTLDDVDAQKVVDLFKYLAMLYESNTATEDMVSAIQTSIDNITFLAKEASKKNPKLNLYITLDKAGKLDKVHYGAKNSITVADLIGNDAKIAEFKQYLIDNKIYNVKEKPLSTNEQFTENYIVPTRTDDGLSFEWEVDTWDSYQEYLMSSEGRTPRFKIKAPPYTENAIEKRSNSPFVNKSFTFSLPQTTEESTEGQAYKAPAKMLESKPEGEEILDDNPFKGVGSLVNKSKVQGLKLGRPVTAESEGTSVPTQSQVVPTPTKEEATTDLDAFSEIESDEIQAIEPSAAEVTPAEPEANPEQATNALNSVISLLNNNDKKLSSPVGRVSLVPYTLDLAAFRAQYPGVIVEVDPNLESELAVKVQDGVLKVFTRPFIVEKGLFHEGFHLFELLAATPEQLKTAYNEVRSRLGNSVVLVEGKEVVGKELTDDQVSEFLAEEYREYIIAGKKNYKFAKVSKKPLSTIQQLFENISKLIDRLLKFTGLRKNTDPEFGIESLFETIQTTTVEVPNIVNVPNITKARLGNLSSNIGGPLLKYMNFKFFDVFINHPHFKDLHYSELSDPEVMNNLYTQVLKDIVETIEKGNYPPILNNINNEVAEDMVNNHRKLLKQYNIKFKQTRDGLENSDAIDLGVELPTQLIEGVNINVREYIGTEIKLLVAGLPSHKTVQRLDQTTEYSDTIGLLHKHLANLPSYEAMVNRLKELSITFPHYKILLQRLGSVNSAYDIYSRKHANLRAAFFNQFKKSQKEFQLGVISDKGIYLLDAMAETTDKNIKDQWRANIATRNTRLYTDSEGKHIINMKHQLSIDGKRFTMADVIGNYTKFRTLLGKNGLAGLENYRLFLNEFGFDIPSRYIYDNEAVDTLPMIIESFLREGAKILKAREKNPALKGKLFVQDIFDPNTVAVKKELNMLSKGIAKYSSKFMGNMRTGSDGKPIYNVGQPTHLDRVVDEINTNGVGNLLPLNKNGTNIRTIGSRLIDTVLRKNKLTTSVLNAFGEERSDKKEIDKLNAADFAIFEINSVFNGHLPFLRSAGRAVEIAITTPKGYIKLRNSVLPQHVKVFKDYLIGEVVAAIAHNNNSTYSHFTKNNEYKGLSVFEDIIGKDSAFIKEVKKVKANNPSDYVAIAQSLINNNNSVITSRIKEYLNKQTQNVINHLHNEGIINKDGDTIDATFIDKEIIVRQFKAENPAFEKADFSSLSRDLFNQLMYTFTFEYISGTIEQTKLFTGDIKQFIKRDTNELFKRTNLHTATVEGSMNDVGFVAELNKVAPRIDNRKHDQTMRIGVKADVKVKSRIQKFYSKINKDAGEATKSMTESDAQSYFTLDGAKSFIRRSGKAYEPQLKTIMYQKQWLFRYMIEKDKRFPELFNEKNFKKIFGEHLPENYTKNNFYYLGESLKYSQLAPIQNFKPQGVAKIINKALADANMVTSVKTSTTIPLPTEIVGTNLFEELIQATVTGMDLWGAESMSKHEKLGNNKGELAPTYNKEGALIPMSEIFGNEAAKHWLTEINWSDFGNQMDVDPETKGKVTLTTQGRRLITVDIFNRGVIDPKYARFADKIERYNELLSKLVEEDFGLLINRLGLSQSENNQWALTDNQKFVDTLIEQIESRLQSDNVATSVDFVMQQAYQYFDMLPTKRQLINLIQGLVRNNIIKTKTKGDMLVQEASTGYETGSRTFDKSGVMLSNTLRFYRPLVDGKELTDEQINARTPEQIASITEYAPAQVMLSLPEDLVDVAKNHLNVSDLNWNAIQQLNKFMLADGTTMDENGRLMGKWEHYDLWKKARTILANRTPAQHLNSIEVFEVVKFFAPFAGPKIVLPSEIVAKSGSDFDIDKLTVYFNHSRFNKKTNSYEVIEHGDNSRGSVENEIYSLMQELALAPENFHSLIRPNNSSIVDKQAVKLRPDAKELTSPSEMVTFPYNSQIAKTQFGAKSLIGIIAVNMTFHPLMQKHPISFNSEMVELFFDHFKGKEGNYEFGHSTDSNGNVISNVLADTATSAVDATKHTLAPIDLINMNTSTANAYFTLMMLGKGDTNPMAFEAITEFMTHPMVRDITHTLSINESAFKEARNTNMEKKDAIKELLSNKGFKVSEKHKFLYEYMRDVLRADTPASLTKAKNNLTKALNFFKSKEDGYLAPGKMNDWLVAEYYLYYIELGKVLKQLQDITRPDVSLPKTRDAVRIRMERARSLIDANILNRESLVELFGDSYIGTYTRVQDNTYDAFSPFDIAESIPAVNDFIWGEIMPVYLNRELAKSEQDLTDVKQKITNTLLTYIIHNTPHAKNGKKLSDPGVYESLVTGKNSVAMRFDNLKKEYDFSDNAFFKQAVAVINEYVERQGKTRVTHYIKLNNTRLTVEEANAIHESIEDLFNHSDKKVRTFARDLILLSFVQSGFQISPVSFFEHLPPQNYYKLVLSLLHNFIANNVQLDIHAKRAIFNYLRTNKTVVPRNSNYKNIRNQGDLLSVSTMSQNAQYEYLSADLKTVRDGKEYWETFLYERTGDIHTDKYGNKKLIFKKLPVRSDPRYMFSARPINDIAIPKELDVVERSDMGNEIMDPYIEVAGETTTPQQVTPTAASTPTKTAAKITLLDSNYPYTKKTAVDNPNTNYVFTENAEAYTASQGLVSDRNAEFPYYPNKPKLKVTSVNNQAGIRTDISGKVNPNAVGIVVKKYQQNAQGIFVAQEGTFKDNANDFEMFKSLNEHAFNRLQSDNKPIVFPKQFALGKAALPKRFAEWLQTQFKDRFGVISELKPNNTSGYSGWGLQVTSVQQTTPTTQQTGQTEQLQLSATPLTSNDVKADKALMDALKTAWNTLGITASTTDQIIFNNERTDAVAKANVLTKTLEYVEGKRGLDTLPEETAHIFVEMLPENHPLKVQMLRDIVDTQYYKDVLAEYGGLYSTPRAYKIEAIGKAIVDAMINENALRLETGVWNKIKNWMRGLFSFVRNGFNWKSPYAKVAIKILDNKLQDVMQESIPAGEQVEYLQAQSWKGRLSMLDDVYLAKIEQNKIRKEKEAAEQRSMGIGRLITPAFESMVPDSDIVQLEQSEADMAASEETIRNINKEELKKPTQLEINFTEEAIMSEQLSNFERFYGADVAASIPHESGRREYIKNVMDGIIKIIC